MSITLLGIRSVTLNRDKMGYREYKVKFLVEDDENPIGPGNALLCPELPQPGDEWDMADFGIDGEFDQWATCKMDATVSIHQETEGDPPCHWIVELRFSNKDDEERCVHEQVDDPLLKEAEISGSFVKYSEEATTDRYGNPIVTSSWEKFKGPQVEFDANRPSIKIRQNVATFQQAYQLPASMNDCLNDQPLWGFPARFIKMNVGPWDRKFYGSCYVYYTRDLEFNINARLDPDTGQVVSGFDRDLLDEGTKALHGHWDVDGTWALDNIDGLAPNPQNPGHFDQFKDKNGENAKVVLDGAGKPAGAVISGSAITICDTQLLVGGAGVQLTVNNPGQVMNPAEELNLNLTDDDSSLVGGTLTITGTDALNHVITEVFQFPITDGTGTVRTANKYKTVTSVQTDDLDITGAQPSLEIVTNNGLALFGKIHVEKYQSANLLLLGIPVSF